MRCYAMFVAIIVFAFFTGGCTATYVPISWGMGERVQALSRSDRTLSILFGRYDPRRQTLRVAGESFDEVMMPSEVPHHLGAYRPDTRLIYRNMYNEYTDKQLRDLMVHELAHHIWFGSMSLMQREEWIEHLDENPSQVRDLVRRLYHKTTDHDTEDFAFAFEYARPVDMEKLARMKLITEEERDVIVADRARVPTPVKADLPGEIADLTVAAPDLQVSTRFSTSAPGSSKAAQ
jgi:hypothetical protein